MTGLPLIVPDVVQVGIEMTCSGRTVMNVLGFENLDDTPMATLLATVKTAWEQSNGPLYRHSSSTAMVGYHGVNLSAVDAPVGYLGSGATGSVAGEISTMGACALIKLSSGTRGRSKQGRVFHGPLVEGQINSDGRTVLGSMVTDLTTAYELFRASMDIAGNQWCVISRVHFDHSNIAASACEGIIGTQRRRIR
jgi:hypothetical protein